MSVPLCLLTECACIWRAKVALLQREGFPTDWLTGHRSKAVDTRPSSWLHTKYTGDHTQNSSALSRSVQRGVNYSWNLSGAAIWQWHQKLALFQARGVVCCAVLLILASHWWRRCRKRNPPCMSQASLHNLTFSSSSCKMVDGDTT